MLLSSTRDRRLALLLVGIAVGLVITRLWLLQGLLTSMRIAGGSMAEALPGEHVEVVCSICGRHWKSDLAQVETTAQLRCPDCGEKVDEESQLTERSATRVIVDRAAYLLASPQRFDVVAFHMTDDPADLGVKRVVALPGEAWSIERGELMVNGRLVRKSFPQFRKLASVVSDPAEAARGPWKPAGAQSQWTSDDDTWHWASSSPITSGENDKLMFHSTAKHPAARTQPAPVSDNDPYNPALARELNPVVDLIAECELSAHDVVLGLHIHDGHEGLDFRWDVSTGTVVVLRQEREVERCRIPTGSQSHSIAWGICDRQLVLVVEGVTVVRLELEAKAKSFSPVATPLAIAASGSGECKIANLRVLRDVYYIDPLGRSGTWHAAPLKDDAFGVLGDNPPLSIDSRHAEHGIRRSQILGRVFPYE